MSRFVVCAVSSEAIDGPAGDAMAGALGAAGAAIVGTERWSGGVELVVEARVEGEARAAAVAMRRAVGAAVKAGGWPIDVAVRAEDARVMPRLVVMDMDSTLITIEVIDELARMHGVGDEVAAITERAMRGELDFEQSLRARVARLKGLPAAALEALAGRLALSEGVERLVETLHAHGVAFAIASGGFTFAASALQARLGLAHAHANALEVVDGALSGGVLGAVVTAERKAAIVTELAEAVGARPAETVAIGDGANDRLMLARAGFGVAFRAKPALAAVADATIDHGGLDRVLAFVGLRA